MVAMNKMIPCVYKLYRDSPSLTLSKRLISTYVVDSVTSSVFNEGGRVSKFHSTRQRFLDRVRLMRPNTSPPELDRSCFVLVANWNTTHSNPIALSINRGRPHEAISSIILCRDQRREPQGSEVANTQKPNEERGGLSMRQKKVPNSTPLSSRPRNVARGMTSQ